MKVEYLIFLGFDRIQLTFKERYTLHYICNQTLLSTYLCTFNELVEHMVVGFPRSRSRDPGPFEQKVSQHGALDPATVVQPDFDEFAETGRVVVTHCFGVSCKNMITNFRYQLNTFCVKLNR